MKSERRRLLAPKELGDRRTSCGSVLAETAGGALLQRLQSVARTREKEMMMDRVV